MAKFLWLCDTENYSTDDLKFFFSINRTFVQFNVFDSMVTNRKEYNFESDKCDAIIVIAVIRNYFEDKIDSEALKNTIKKFKTDVSTFNNIDIRQLDSEDFSVSVNSNMVEEWFTDMYIENKRSTASDLIDSDLIPEQLLEEFEDQEVESDKLNYILNSTVQEDACKKIFSDFSKAVDEDTVNVFLENNKANPLEMLMEESEHINIETDIR